MNFLLHMCLLAFLACDSEALLCQSILQDRNPEQDHQSQEQTSYLQEAGFPIPAEAGKSRSKDLSSIARLNEQAVRCQSQGQYRQAEMLFLQALMLYEQYQGPDQLLLLVTTLNQLARLYFDQGKYSAVEPLLRRAMTTGERTLGTEDLEVAITLDNLGNLYFAQGYYAEVEPLLLRALRIRERKLGSEHPDVATSLSNWGNLLFWQGKYAEAEKLQRRSLLIRQKTLGPSHPDLVSSTMRLAQVSQLQGRLTEAEGWYRQSLTLLEKIPESEYADTVVVLSNLAGPVPTPASVRRISGLVSKSVGY
jgi:tetratricopeptide (TPR) repeat protein